VTNGVKEVILTGVDITDYGGDLPGSPKLSSLVRRILNLVPDLPRLRLSSLDPKEIDDDLIDLFANEIRLMPHVHLSLQSGDPMILKRMKRRHCPEDALSVVSKLRSVRPDIVFGADIIAGFPTETEEMFQNTIRHLRECGIVYLHSFPYSARQGTPAARMPQVEKPVIKERAKILREIASAALDEFLRNKIGQKVNVLLERNMQGRADDYAPFKCFAGGDWSAYALGDVLGVKVVDVEDGFLIIQTIS
jgi:threonylcarbamoyladenosine tRNA methylthiotransferase MtaB